MKGMTRYTKKDSFSIKIARERFVLRKFSYLPISKRDKGKVLGEDAIVNDAVNKLSALEDIEEELGIDLITLFKALKDGVYHWHINVYGNYNMNFITKVFKEVELDISSKKLYHISEISGTPTWELKLKDYGKTWALTKEELE